MHQAQEGRTHIGGEDAARRAIYIAEFNEWETRVATASGDDLIEVLAGEPVDPFARRYDDEMPPHSLFRERDWEIYRKVARESVVELTTRLDTCFDFSRTHPAPMCVTQ